MADGFDQGGFRAPRVPFDLRCVTLASVGFLVLLLADRLLGKSFSVDAPFMQMLLGGFAHFTEGVVETALTWWQYVITLVVFFAIWAFFGGALMRASGLRLTRDEPLSLKESLQFGAANWHSFIAAPLIVVLFAVFFLLCNMAGGLVISLWGIGSTLLNFVIFPLVLLSSLLITFSLLGGLVTLPLMWAGIAVEQNGALEAVSRAFSYIFARPLRFFFGYALILLLAAIVLLLADHFEATVKHSLQAGVVRSNLDDLIRKEPEEVSVLAKPHQNAPKTVREKEGISNLGNVRDAKWYDAIGFLWMWLLLSLFMLGFTGYAIYIFLGGTVSLYLQLRKEVDGADEGEIYPPLEEEELDTASEGTEPRWVAAEESGGAESAPEEGSDAEPPEQEDTAETQDADDEVSGEDQEDKEPEG
jgi:hypothetical protein